MKILILCTHLNPGGISRYVINLAAGLKDLGHDVWVGSCGGDWTEELESRKLGVVRLPIDTKSIASPKVVFSFLRLSRFIRKARIEVIHCNTRVTQMLGFLAFVFLRVPYVSAFHGFYRPSLLRKKIKLCGLRAIAVSASVGEHLTGDLAIDKDRVRVVYNGIDVTPQPVAGAPVRQALGFAPDEFLIGILGRISEEKGHMLAIEAFHALTAQDPSARFLVSGTGKREAQLKRYISEHGLDHLVRFLDIPAQQFLSVLDLLLVPSRKEGFGFAVIEAFAAEVPVIGFNTGGIAEIIRDKENGVLFNDYTAVSLTQAIKALKADGGLRTQITQQARRDLSRYSIRAMAQGTEAVYREVLAG